MSNIFLPKVGKPMGAEESSRKPKPKIRIRDSSPIFKRMFRGMHTHPDFVQHYRAGARTSGMRYHRGEIPYQLGLLQKSSSPGYTWEQANYAL